MKKVGIIGGMGPESTVPYYKNIVYGVKEILKDDVFPALSIESVDVFKVLKFCEQKCYDKLTEYLLISVRNLCNCGCDFIVLAANTPHIVFDLLKQKCPVPMLSIVEETAVYAEKHGMKKLGLLGTKTTMLADYYRKPFTEKNISIEVPDDIDMDYISTKISTELERGILKDETRNEIVNIMLKMKEKYCLDGIILGCTELPLIIKKDISPVEVLDTMEIHINSIIENILN